MGKRTLRSARPAGTGLNAAVAATEPGRLTRLPGIDAHDGRARMLGNDRLYRRLLIRLYDDERDFAARFGHAVAHGDLAKAERLAHDLQAVTGLLGASVVHGSAKALEEACHSRVARHAIDPLLARVAADLAVVVAGLQALKDEAARISG